MDGNTSINYDDLELAFPAMKSVEDRWRFLLKYAVLAPSARNTQPWIWESEGDAVKLYADRNRLRPAGDPDNREMIASCGAALMHLRLALRHFGYRGEISYFPDEHDPHLLARVQLGRRQRPTTDEDMLFYAIPKRHSNRGTFQQREVPESVLAALRCEADREGAWLHLIEDESDRGAVIDLIAEGDEIQWRNREFRSETARWIRPNDTHELDGIPGSAFGMNDAVSHLAPLAMRIFDLGEFQAYDDWVQAGCAPVLAVLGTAADSPRQWLKAGEALARVLLRACVAGVDASFFNQPVEAPGLWPQLRQIIGRCGFPQLVFRLGYAVETAAPTARRPSDKVLTTNAALYEVAESFHMR